MKKEKVYISGAMSGVDRPVYRRRFIAAETMLQAKGYNTVNPCRFVYARWHWLYKLLGYKWVLLLDLWMLSRCDKIYVIPIGSRLSLGVRAEVNFARALHMEFFNGNDNVNGNDNDNVNE